MPFRDDRQTPPPREPREPHEPHEPQPAGEISCGEYRITLRGCALQLALWIARHQRRINETAADGGQLTLHWKGIHAPSIAGEIKTRL